MDKQRTLNSISAEVTLRHLAFVTYSVPAQRVRPHLPRDFLLETFTDARGRERALISTGCFLNEDLRWSLVPKLSMNYHQITFRTYVRYGDRVGAYFFGTDVGSGPAYMLQRSFARNVAWATIHLKTAHTKDGYDRYSCRVRSVHGETRFKLKARHRLSEQDEKALAQNITYRLHGFFESSARMQADQFVQHKRMTPYSGELVAGRFEFWERMGILTQEESLDAHSVLIQPSIRFKVFPAVPIKLLFPATAKPPVSSEDERLAA